MNKNDFKCGQWLTSSYKVTGLKAIKFKCWDPNYPNCPLLTEAIADGVLDVNHNTGGIWNSDYGRGLRPIHLDEIQQYLPDGHPDKYVPTIEKWSVGSYVVFLRQYGGHPKGTISKIINNEAECAQVENSFHSRHEGCRLYKDKECKWFPNVEAAEKFAATLKELVKPFPEYVECVNDISSSGELNNGQIYQVEQVDTNFKQYKLKGLKSKRDFYRFKPSTKEEFEKSREMVGVDKTILSVFPREGSCETIDERLLKYLNSRNDKPSLTINNQAGCQIKGIAWNSSSSWYYYGSSNKRQYALADLEHLFDTTESRRWSAGTYGVLMSDYSGIVNDFKKGFIDVIVLKDFRNNEQYIVFNSFGSYKPENLQYTKGVEIKWFETKEAAEIFVKFYMPSIVDSSGSMKSTNPCCEIALSDSSDASYKLDTQGTDERPIYPVFIKDDKPKQIKEEPIKLNLTSRKNVKINLVV